MTFCFLLLGVYEEETNLRTTTMMDVLAAFVLLSYRIRILQ